MIVLKAKVCYGELAKENPNCYDDEFEANTGWLYQFNSIYSVDILTLLKVSLQYLQKA